MEGIINPEAVALIQSKLQQEVAKLAKVPETIPNDFTQATMYAKEAHHRDQRSQSRAKKPRKIKKLSEKIFRPKGAS